MMPLWLLPLGLYALSRGKSKTYKKPIASNTGLYITSEKIEVLNRRSAAQTIQSTMDLYRGYENLLVEEVNIVKLFEYVTKTVCPNLYKKMLNRTLNQREKIILSLFFIMVFDRLYAQEPYKEQFIKDYLENKQSIIFYLLDLTETDEKNIDEITKKFEITQSFP